MRRYSYDMSHHWVTGANIGQLLPIMCQEVVPGDRWNGTTSMLVRTTPLELPAYISMRIKVHFFYVPHRIVDDSFEDFITGKDPTLRPPTISMISTDTLPEAFGIGARIPQAQDIRAHHIRAYNAVFNEHFLPQQEGQQPPERSLDRKDIATVYHPVARYLTKIRAVIMQAKEAPDATFAELVPSTVDLLQDAMRRQRQRQRRALYGDSYDDYLRSMGINVSESRLNRPEHLAQGTGEIGISEVVATATSASENTGSYRGHGISGFRVRMPPRMFPEHGTLLGLMTIRPRLQVLSRFDRTWHAGGDKDTFFQPELAGTPTPVPVLRREIAADDEEGAEVFGYVHRDDWLRSAEDVCANQMRDAGQEAWHGFRYYADSPSIDNLHVVDRTLYDNIFQDQTAGGMRFHVYAAHNMRAARIVPRVRT
jgi:hypothetical protein